MKILRDSREKLGWDFIFDEYLDITKASLKCGDYTSANLRDSFRVERKASTAELYNNLGTKVCRERFYREMEKLERFEHAYIVCEFSESNMYEFPKNSGIPQAMIPKLRMSNKYFIKLVKDLERNFDIQIVFCNNRDEAELFTYNIMSSLEKKIK